MQTVRGLAWGSAPRPADPAAKVPLAQFNAELERRDREEGRGDGALVAKAAREVVRSWARANAATVATLRGDPARMVEVFAREVQPFLLDDPGAARVLGVDNQGARLRLDNALLEPYKVALLAAFVELSGVTAHVRRDGAEYVVGWTFPEEAQAGALRRALVTIRAPFLAATLVPVLLGTAVAAASGAFDGGWFALGLLGALLVHVGTNTANDWFDARAGRDRAPPQPGAYHGHRVVARGVVGARLVGATSLAAFALALAIGIWLTVERGWGILALGAVGVALGALYTLDLRARGLGEFAVALGFGPVLVLGAYYVQAQRFDVAALAASIPLAALVAAVLVLDRGEHARWAHPQLVAAAFAALLFGVLVGSLPAATLVALLGAPLAWSAVRALRTRPASANAYTVILHLVTGALLAAGFLLEGVQ